MLHAFDIVIRILLYKNGDAESRQVEANAARLMGGEAKMINSDTYAFVPKK